MKIKDIITLFDGIDAIIRQEHKTPYKFNSKTRLNLLRTYSSVKEGLNHYKELRDSAMKEINPNTTTQANGNIVVSLEDEKGKKFMDRLEEIHNLDMDDFKIYKITYEDLLEGDNDIGIDTLEKLAYMIEEKSE